MPRPRRAPPRTRSVLLPLLLGGLLLYAGGLGAFSLLHYGAANRPEAGQVVRDFHAFLGLGPSPARAEPPPAPTPPPPPPPRPAPPPPAVHERSPLDRIAETVRRVRREAPALRRHARDESFEAARVALLSELCEARDELGAILDEQPANVRANDLWDRLQELLAALRKL